MGPDRRDQEDALKTILIGYDGTRPAEQALARAAELAKAFGAKVIVVSVVAPMPVTAGGAGAFGLESYYSYRAEDVSLAADERIWEQHRQRVQSFFADAGVGLEFAGVIGQPAEEIIGLAAEHDADLIVVGTREPGFLERLFGGSVSQDVARRAGCDVLVVHSAEG